MSEVGKNIAQRRKAMGMTQEELAKKMGYKSKSTINKIELGINDVVQSKIVRFAEVLQTTPAVLMGWEQVQKKNDTLTDIVLKLRSDDELLSLVDNITQLNPEQRASIMQIVSVMLKG